LQEELMLFTTAPHDQGDGIAIVPVEEEVGV
jgi:hypothetical protein